MDAFEVGQTVVDTDIPVISLKGYFSGEGGQAVAREVDAALNLGRKRILIDLVGCTVINSPGIAVLMDLAMKIVDDFQGRLILVGLDNSKKQFLTMTGVLPLAGTAATVDEGCRAARA